MNSNSLEWMAWTWPTAAFFAVLVLLVAAVSLPQRRHAQPARRGWLPMATTPGDRLFVALLASAFVLIAWLLATPPDTPAWPTIPIAIALGALLLRYG